MSNESKANKPQGKPDSKAKATPKTYEYKADYYGKGKRKLSAGTYRKRAEAVRELNRRGVPEYNQKIKKVAQGWGGTD